MPDFIRDVLVEVDGYKLKFQIEIDAKRDHFAIVTSVINYENATQIAQGQFKATWAGPPGPTFGIQQLSIVTADIPYAACVGVCIGYKVTRNLAECLSKATSQQEAFECLKKHGVSILWDVGECVLGCIGLS